MNYYSFFGATLFCSQVNSFVFPSVNNLRCTSVLSMVALNLAVFCYSATLMWRRRAKGNRRRAYYYDYCCFYDAKHCLRKFVFKFRSGSALFCIPLLPMAALKFAVFCCSATLMWGPRMQPPRGGPWGAPAQILCWLAGPANASTAYLC